MIVILGALAAEFARLGTSSRPGRRRWRTRTWSFG